MITFTFQKLKPLTQTKVHLSEYAFLGFPILFFLQMGGVIASGRIVISEVAGFLRLRFGSVDAI